MLFICQQKGMILLLLYLIMDFLLEEDSILYQGHAFPLTLSAWSVTGREVEVGRC